MEVEVRKAVGVGSVCDLTVPPIPHSPRVKCAVFVTMSSDRYKYLQMILECDLLSSYASFSGGR